MQVSSVQTLLSLLTRAGPPVQTPAVLHVSFVVHASPSLQLRPGTGVYTQPVAGLHVSSVQTLLSLHTRAGPPVQIPVVLHVSLVVQASPSSQLRPGTGV